jgi:hypothetical protein
MNGNLYILTGSEYKKWDGTTFSDVAGYVPLIAISTPPAGGGTLLEQVNKLTGSKRQKFSPNGLGGDANTIYHFSEQNVNSVDSVKLNGVALTYSATGLDGAYGCNLTNGTVWEWGYSGEELVPVIITAGTNTLEVQWTKNPSDVGTVRGMKYSEFYNGANDTRVFLYGDGTNKILYSGIDENGRPNPEYFPDLNVAAIGDANTPVTGLVKHYDTLLAFKTDSAYSIRYGTLTLEDTSTIAAFSVLPINKTIGNTAIGQAILVENNPRTLDGRSIYEWLGVNSTITNDQRNAKRISQRIETTLKEIDFSKAYAYFDKINHEYYVMENGIAVVHNTENNTWYLYRDFPATCMIVYKDEVYIGTSDGYIRHFSRDYRSDNGTNITATWKSGSMDFGADSRYKSSPMLWVSIKPEENAAIDVSVLTDYQNDFGNYAIIADSTKTIPESKRLKIKAKRFTNYKLLLIAKPNYRATILGADIDVLYLGNAK